MTSTYSIYLPTCTTHVNDVLPFAALTQWSNAFRLWQGQGLGIDPFQTFPVMAAAGFRVPIGLGVTPMPLRHPHEAALQALCASVGMGHPLVAGYGPGSLPFQTATLGAPYRSQLAATGEYLSTVRSLVGGDVLDFDGEYYTCHTGIAAVPGPPIEVGAGVLRPAMARLAGQVADVAITSLVPASYLRDTLIPAIRAGAESAGRPTPKVVSVVPVALEEPERNGIDLALAGSAVRLAMPHYQDTLRRSGIVVGAADAVHDAQALIDGGAFLYGDLDRVSAMLGQYEEIGVDDIVLDVTGVTARFGVSAGLAELETILDRMAPQ